MPDPILLRALDAAVKGILAEHPTVAFRINLRRDELKIDGRPTLIKFETLLKVIHAELEELTLAGEVSGTTTPAAPKTKALHQRPTKGEGGKGENGKSEGEKGKGWKEPC